MIERRDQPRLVEEHPHEPLVRRLVREDPLEHDELGEALDAVGAREEQLRHPAGAERLQQRVPPEPPADLHGGVEVHPRSMMPHERSGAPSFDVDPAQTAAEPRVDRVLSCAMRRRHLLAAAAVACSAGCGRLGFDDLATAIEIREVRPAWAMSTGGPVEVVLADDAAGVTVTIGGVPCGSPTISGATITCQALAHAPASVDVEATRADGANARFAGRFSYLTPGMYQLGGPLDDRTSGVAIDLGRATCS